MSQQYSASDCITNYVTTWYNSPLPPAEGSRALPVISSALEMLLQLLSSSAVYSVTSTQQRVTAKCQTSAHSFQYTNKKERSWWLSFSCHTEAEWNVRERNGQWCHTFPMIQRSNAMRILGARIKWCWAGKMGSLGLLRVQYVSSATSAKRC